MMLTTCSLSIGELRSSNSTARHHSPRQIQKSKHLFAEQGIVVPIVIDENHHIIDGHLRLAVAQDLGKDKGQISNICSALFNDRKITRSSRSAPYSLVETELLT